MTFGASRNQPGDLQMRPRRFTGLLFICLVSHGMVWGQAASRVEEIRQRRIDKQARIWPERTSGIVKQVSKFTERGLLEGARSGEGTNGFQVVLGGMRSGNGASFGVGYRRVDLLNERLGFRTTARGTIQEAYMFDFELNFPRLADRGTEFQLYTKYENSPLMDYYGPGPGSNRANRSSYRLEDFAVDLRLRQRLWNRFYARALGGLYLPNTGPGKRKDFPTTDEKFTPEETPGLGVQPRFLRAGATLQYDWRDLPSGPRSGGNYFATYTRYWDQQLRKHSFHNLDTAVEQYIPYFNSTRVIALRLAAVMTYAGEGQSIPFYLQPTLGGNQYLRGFARYRFYDQSAILAVAEHRWHLFSGGHAALFFEAGKVAPKASQVNFHNLEYSGGIGFRFTLGDAVITRIDNAVSREGYRFIWTFENMW